MQVRTRVSTTGNVLFISKVQKDVGTFFGFRPPFSYFDKNKIIFVTTGVIMLFCQPKQKASILF